MSKQAKAREYHTRRAFARITEAFRKAWYRDHGQGD